MAAYERLPTSEKTPPPPPPSRIGPKVQVALYMIAWTVSSNSTILFNKWIIDNSGFGYRACPESLSYAKTTPC